MTCPKCGRGVEALFLNSETGERACCVCAYDDGGYLFGQTFHPWQRERNVQYAMGEHLEDPNQEEAGRPAIMMFVDGKVAGIYLPT